MPKARVRAPLDTRYTYSRMGMQETDSDSYMTEGVEADMIGTSSIDDGLSGRIPIDTTYENTSQSMAMNPRSNMPKKAINGMMPNHSGVDGPAPINTKRYQYSHRNY